MNLLLTDEHGHRHPMAAKKSASAIMIRLGESQNSGHLGRQRHLVIASILRRALWHYASMETIAPWDDDVFFPLHDETLVEDPCHPVNRLITTLFSSCSPPERLEQAQQWIRDAIDSGGISADQIKSFACQGTLEPDRLTSEEIVFNRQTDEITSTDGSHRWMVAFFRAPDQLTDHGQRVESDLTADAIDSRAEVHASGWTQIWLEAASVDWVISEDSALDDISMQSSYTHEAVDLCLVRTCKYRDTMKVHPAELDEAAAKMAYYYETLRKANDFVDAADIGFDQVIESDETFKRQRAAFHKSVCDDLNLPEAFESIDATFKSLNDALSMRKAGQRKHARRLCLDALRTIKHYNGIISFFDQAPDAYLARHRNCAALRYDIDIHWVERQLSHRSAARIARDFARADEILADLVAKRILVMDRPNGTTDWSIREGISQSS